MVLVRHSASIASDSEIDGSKAIAASADRVAVADVSGVTMFENGKKINTISVKDGCSAVALNGSHLAYGGSVSPSSRLQRKPKPSRIS